MTDQVPQGIEIPVSKTQRLYLGPIEGHPGTCLALRDKQEETVIGTDMDAESGKVMMRTLMVALQGAAPEICRAPEVLDARMVSKGMIPLSQLLSGDTPLGRFEAHTGVRSIDTFGAWLERKNREYSTMRMRYEIGDDDKDDDLFSWVFAHAAAFKSVFANFRQATENHPKQSTHLQ